MSDTENLTCYKHPNRKTLLRCNKCNRPICTQCAVQTPTGYRCRDCVRGQQKIFNNAKPLDYVLAVLLAAGLSYLGSYIPSYIGFFTIFAAPFVGTLIVEAIKKLTGNRRSRALFRTTTAAAVIGSLPLLAFDLLRLFTNLQSGFFNVYGLMPLIWQVAYTILLSGSVHYRMSGIKIK